MEITINSQIVEVGAKAGFDSYTAQEWEQAGFDPYQAEEFVGYGMSVEDAIAKRDA